MNVNSIEDLTNEADHTITGIEPVRELRLRQKKH